MAFKPPEEFEYELHDEENGHMWLLAIRAVEEYRAEFGHYAGL